MITIEKTNTKRRNICLNELSIQAEMALCALDEAQHEKGLTAFLEAAQQAGSDSHPRSWSVGERLFALAHYCCHVMPDGPDYAVTNESRLSDYLQLERDDVAEISFQAAGDDWLMQPLLGAAAEAIENLQPIDGIKGRAHWIIGGMAAQLHRVGEAVPDPIADGVDYSTWLTQRIKTFQALPSSDFEAIYRQYANAMAQGAQLFQTWFDEHGIIVLPKALEGGAASNLPPARFRVLACLSDSALSLFGKST